MDSLIAHFSATVPEATEKFSAAASRIGAELRQFANPLPGPGGETLHATAARIGPPDATRVLLVISGEHGVEGYGGAGIQTALLDRGFDLPDGVAVLMVHLINPWGAAWNRRENEDNVDLFRNFTYALKPSQVDPLYAEIDEAVNLRAIEGPGRAEADRKLAALVAEYGEERLSHALRRGQYDNPLGLTFHGRGPTWSKLVLDRMILELIPNCADLVVLDLHSGTPGYGDIMVVSYDLPESASGKRLTELFGDVYFAGQDASIPSHRDPYPWTFVEALLPGVELFFVPVELCSEVRPLSFDDVREHHYFHTYGDPTSEAAQANGQLFRRAYYVEEDAWKLKVAEGGIGVFLTLLDDMAKQPSRPR